MVEATTADVVAQARQILVDCGHQEDLVEDLAKRAGEKQ